MANPINVGVRFSLDAAALKSGVQQASRDFTALGQAATAASSNASGGLQQVSQLTQSATSYARQFTQAIAQQGSTASISYGSYLKQLTDVIKVQEQANTTLAKTGVSAAQTAAALRQVPAQFTDIVVGLQSGQAPMTVLLQQGGQLKDMFGGAGNAAKALGGYVMGLVNPFTVAAGVAGALAVAYYKGSEEATAYNRAIVLTGNAAGVTAGQLQAQAQAVAANAGTTQSAAASTLAQLTATGRVASEQYASVAAAALAMEKAGVQAVEKSVDQFSALGQKPVEASLKLNEQTNYLTAAVYRQIKALDDQGRSSEAAALAQQTYAEAMTTRSAQIRGDLGLLERAWGGLASVAKSAWDTMLGVGRAETAQDKLSKISARLQQLQADAARESSFGETGGGAATGRASSGAAAKRDAEIQALQAEQAALNGIVYSQNAAAKAAADKAEAEALGVKWAQEGDRYLSKQQTLRKEIARAEAEGAKLIEAGLLTQAQLNERIRAIKDKNTDATGQSEVATIQAKTLAAQQYLETLKSQGLEAKKLTEGEQLVIQIKQQLTTSLTSVQRAEKLRALAAAEALAVVDKQVQGEEIRRKGLQDSKNAYDALVDATRRAADQTRTQADELEASNAMWGKGKVAVEEYRLALIQAKLNEIDQNPDSYRSDYIAEKERELEEQRRKVAATREAEYKTLSEKQQEYTRQVAEEAQLYQDEVGILGLTGREREKVVAIRKVELDLAKRLAEIERSGATEERKQELIDAANAAAEVAKTTAAAKADMNATTDIINSVDRTAASVWSNVTQGGVDSFKKVGQTIKSAVLDLIYQLTIKKWIVSVTAQVTTLFTGGGSGILGNLFGGGDSMLGSFASTLGSAATALTTATNSALATAQSWLGMTGTAAQASTAAANGVAYAATGSGSMAATIGSYAPYVAAALLAYNVLSGLDGGETRTGGQYAVAYDGQVKNNRRGETYQYVGQQFNRDNSLNADGTRTAVTNGQAYLIEADGMGKQEKAVRDAVAATATSINDTLKALGSKATTSGYWAGLETSGNGRGGVFSGGSLSNGKTFGESGKGDNYSGTLYEKWSTNSPNSQEAMANFTLDLKQSYLQALQADMDELPKVVGKLLKDQNVEELSSSEVDTLIAAIGSQITAVKQFNEVVDSMPFESLKGLSFDAAAGLVELSGGIDKLSSNLSSYLQNYYSETERQDQVRKNISASLADVGLSLPATREAFKALVEAQDKETESGRKAWAALMAVQDAFASVTPAAKSAADAAAEQAAAQAEAVAAQQKANQSATDAIYATLQRSVDAQRKVLDSAHAAAQAAVSNLQGVFDTLKGAAQSLYQESSATNATSAAKGRSVIDQALATGTLPSQSVLSEAIAAAQAGLTRANYSSLDAMETDRLVLAGKLAALQDITGTQLSSAEQQLQATQSQIDALNGVLDTSKAQLDELRGIDNSILTIGDALGKYATAVATEKAGLTSGVTVKPGVLVVNSDQATSETQTVAAKLGSLQGLTASQVAAAELQYQATQDQTSTLRDSIDAAATDNKAQLGALTDLNTSVVGVSDAVSELAAVLLDPTGKNGASATKPGVQTNGSSGQFSVGGGGGSTASPTPRESGYGAGTGKYWGFSNLGSYGYAGYEVTDANAVARYDSIWNYLQSDFGAGSKEDLQRVAETAHQFGVSQADIATASGFTPEQIRDMFGAAGISSFAVGTDYVPNDMLAQIHQGERIVPAAYNRSDETNASIVDVLNRVLDAIQRVATGTGSMADILQAASRGPFFAMKAI